MKKHNEANCMDVNLWYDHDKFWGKNTYDLSVPCEWAQHKLYKNAWIAGIVPSKQKLGLMELEQITTKPINCMDVTLRYDHDKFWGKNTYDLSVPCEWAKHKLYKNAWIVGIGPSKQKLWLMEIEQITKKPIAWTLIYDTITINFEGENTYDLSVLCEWAHHKLYKNAWIVGIGPSQQKLWLMELEQITKKPITWTLIYVTITKNSEGENTYDLSVPCEWAHHKLYKNAWVVGIGPSNQKLWLMELEKTQRSQLHGR